MTPSRSRITHIYLTLRDVGLNGRDVVDRPSRMLVDSALAEHESVLLPVEFRGSLGLDSDLDHDLATIAEWLSATSQVQSSMSSSRTAHRVPAYSVPQM